MQVITRSTPAAAPSLAGPGEWLVPSRSEAGVSYTVTLFSEHTWSCTCRWGSSSGTRGKCFHARAALIAAHAQRNPSLALELSAALGLLQAALAAYEARPTQDLKELIAATKDRLTALTRPGKVLCPHCGGGGLAWSSVRASVERCDFCQGSGLVAEEAA